MLRSAIKFQPCRHVVTPFQNVLNEHSMARHRPPSTVLIPDKVQRLINNQQQQQQSQKPVIGEILQHLLYDERREAALPTKRDLRQVQAHLWPIFGKPHDRLKNVASTALERATTSFEACEHAIASIGQQHVTKIDQMTYRFKNGNLLKLRNSSDVEFYDLIFKPSDVVSSGKAVELAWQLDKAGSNVMIQASKLVSTKFYGTNDNFEVGKARILHKPPVHEVSHCLVVGMGPFSLIEAWNLAKSSTSGLGITVLDPFTIKPFDVDGINEALRRNGGNLVVADDDERCHYGELLLAELLLSSSSKSEHLFKAVRLVKGCNNGKISDAIAEIIRQNKTSADTEDDDKFLLPKCMLQRNNKNALNYGAKN